MAEGRTQSDDPLVGRLGMTWRELRRGSSTRAVRRRIFEGLVGEMDIAQFDTLALLVERGEARMRDLAEALRVGRSTATRAADRLVEAGLARRGAALGDGRGVVLRPSEAGKVLHDEVVGRYRRFLVEVLEGFSHEERRQLVELLERLVARVDAVVSAPE